jgi:hypothetical protein
LCIQDSGDSVDGAIPAPIEAFAMKLALLKSTLLALVLTGAAGATSSAPPAPGTETEYKFREAPLNSFGVKSLTDLRGKPIVIDFWGKN